MSGGGREQVEQPTVMEMRAGQEKQETRPLVSRRMKDRRAITRICQRRAILTADHVRNHHQILAAAAPRLSFCVQTAARIVTGGLDSCPTGSANARLHWRCIVRKLGVLAGWQARTSCCAGQSIASCSQNLEFWRDSLPPFQDLPETRYRGWRVAATAEDSWSGVLGVAVTQNQYRGPCCARYGAESEERRAGTSPAPMVSSALSGRRPGGAEPSGGSNMKRHDQVEGALA